MKLLWVSFGMPYPPDSGARLRDFHLIRHISRNAKITLFCLIPPGSSADPGDLENFCERIEIWKMPACFPPLQLLGSIPLGAWRNFFPDAAARIAQIIEDECPCILQIEHSLLAAYRAAAPPGARCRTLLSLHNVAFEQYRRFAHLERGIIGCVGYLLKSRIMRRAEAYYVPQFDSTLTVSWAENALLAGLIPGVQSTVIENGVDCTALRPLAHGGCTILFVGVMNYPPNADAVLFFCRRILPLISSRIPDARFDIVGHAPPHEVMALGDTPGVKVWGRVDDVLPHYAAAAITIAPLRAGGGTRLKILESMALGRPVVATSIGCEGLHVEHGRHLLIADSPEQFAECAERLLRDPALRDRIAQAARRLVEERYDWPVIGDRLMNAYRKLVPEPVTQ